MEHTATYSSGFSAAKVYSGLPIIIYRGASSNRINRLVDQRYSLHAVLHSVDSLNDIVLALDLSGAAILAIDLNEYHQLGLEEQESIARLCEERLIPIVVVLNHQQDAIPQLRNDSVAEVLRLDMIDGLLVDKIKSLLNDRKRKQEFASIRNELEVTRRRMDDYMYIISHDFKAPLRGLASLTDFIFEELSGTSLSKEARDLLEMMRSRTDFMQKMVDDLLHFSRITSRHHEPEHTDTKQLIINTIEENAELKDIRLDVAADLPILFTDKVRLHEVFLQLLKNGAEFNDAEEKCIVVDFKDAPDELEFSVQDNGRGIKPEHHERVFGLFQKLHAKEQGNGTGTGLTIVKNIVEQQEGSVWIESVPGSGTRVHFTWRK